MELGVKKVAMSQRLKPKNLTRTFYLDTKRTLDEVPFASEIPQPKPQELLDIQEKNRKQRLLESLNKIGGRLEDTSLDFINREEFKFGGKPLTAEQKQAIIDAYNNFKKQKNFLPNLTDILESLPKAKHNNLYRIKQVLNKEKLKYSSAINPEKRKAADKIRVEAQKEKANPFKDNKALENKFIKDVEKRYEFPKRSSAAIEAGVLSNPELAKKYGVSERKIDRLVEKYAKDLSYPKQTLEGEAKKKAEQKIRRDKLIKEVSDKKIEGKIRDVKKGVKGIDLAHKASLRQFKDLGLEYYVDNLGFDKSKVNQELIIPTEQKLESLHKQRMNILKKVKPNKVPKSVQKELEKINLKMSKLSLESDGVLQAVLIDEKTLKPFVFNKNYANVVGQGLIDKPVKDLTKTDIDFIKSTFPQAAKTAKAMKIPTATDSKNIAKKLASFGFKCKLSDGTTCNNPMAYLDDIKKQQAIAKGSGNAAANAAKKLSAGKAIMREFIGPAALTFELAAAVPLGYLSYKAGLPPARIANQLTYGAFGDTETARLKKEAIKLGIDTSEIQQALDFEKVYRQAGVTASQEQDFRGPDDEMLYPQQYEKAFKDLGEEVNRFESAEQYKRYGSQLQQVRDLIAQKDADRAAEIESRIADSGGIDKFINYNSGGRVNYSNGSDGTALAIEESLEAFQRYLKAGGKLSYKDFIAVGGEGVSKFFNAGGRVGFADGPDNPKRRTFLKVMAGIASLPIVGKFFKGAKTAKVVKLANTTTKMPDWFPAFVDNAFKKGIAKKIDADLTEIEIPELPDVKVRAHDDGRIQVEGKNAYNEEYYIDYEPPGYVVVDETTGKAVKKPGDFVATDTEYRMISPEDYDIDGVNVDEIDDILGGSSTKLEGFAKGTNKEKYTIGQKRIDEADARGASKDESLRADINDPYGDVDPTDFADD